MSESKAKLAIVIVNWNTVEVTINCLRSLWASGCIDSYNVVVVDNASTDDSCRRIRSEFETVVLEENSKNIGFAAANNQVLKSRLDDSEYFLLLNSDTIVLGDVIERSIEYMDARPEVGAMGCRVLNTDGSVQLTCSGFPTVFHAALQLFGIDRVGVPILQGYRMTDWDRSNERSVDVISGCYLLVRSCVVRSVGLLDEDFFFFGEETDWCWRIKKVGWVLRFAPVGEIIHHGSVSARKLNYKRDLLLSNAIVRFNRKCYGEIAAISVFLVLFFFNLSRATCHFFLIPFGRGRADRAFHFFRVVTQFKYAWPSFRSRDLIDL